MKKLIYIAASLLFFSSCEDIIELEVKDGRRQLVIDAWLTDQEEEQVIKLSISQAYFDQTEVDPALNAIVTIFEEDSTAHHFLDADQDGSYTLPKEAFDFLETNKPYLLYVNYEGESFAATSILKRVPPIDSIAYEEFSFPVEPNDDYPKDGFLAQFYGFDPLGEGDTYWIKTTKNGEELNHPNRISLAYDAGFSPGSQSDGLLFIQPIRQSINDGLYLHGDSIKVELWSVTEDAFYYLYQVRQESNNTGIFATAPSNIPSNIFNLNSSSEEKALGYFGISAISSFETQVDSLLARPEQ